MIVKQKKRLSPDEKKERQEQRLSRIRLQRARAQLKEQETANELEQVLKH